MGGSHGSATMTALRRTANLGKIWQIDVGGREARARPGDDRDKLRTYVDSMQCISTSLSHNNDWIAHQPMHYPFIRAAKSGQSLNLPRGKNNTCPFG